MNENYLGNPNLKRSNVNVEYSKEQIAEYILSIGIHTKDKQNISFNLQEI